MSIEFSQEGNEYVGKFQATANEMSIYIKTKGDDRANVSLQTSLDGIDYCHRDFLIDAGKEILQEKEVGYSGVIKGQYIKLVSNLPVVKCIVLTNN